MTNNNCKHDNKKVYLIEVGDNFIGDKEIICDTIGEALCDIPPGFHPVNGPKNCPHCGCKFVHYSND